MSTNTGQEAYAQWVRRAISRGRTANEQIVPLFDSSVAEPVELLRQLVEEAFRSPITSRYDSVFVNGNAYLIDALAARYQVPAARIVTTTGATNALSIICRAYLRPGDHILVESPGFDLFSDIGLAEGAEVGTFSREAGSFQISEAEFESQIKPNTKLIVISDLHNPSGMLLQADALERLAQIADGHGARLIVDEVYGDYARGHRVPTAAHRSPNIIAVNSLTKTFGLSTLRCGWIIASESNLQPIREWTQHFEFGVSKLSHAVAALVVERTERFEAYVLSVLQEARPLIVSYMDRWRRQGFTAGEVADFGCICFPRLNHIPNTIRFSEWFANETGIIVAPGEFFGAPGHIRIGFAQEPEVLRFGLEQLERAFQNPPPDLYER